MEHRCRHGDGAHVLRGRQARQVLRRFVRSSSTSAAARVTQRTSRRWCPHSTSPPSSTSTSTIGTQQPVQRSSAWNTAAVTKMELTLNETSKFDQYIDDWDTAARPAQQRSEHSGRREDGAHTQRDLQVRPVHRRLGHDSPTNTAELGTQRPSRRWSSCSALDSTTSVLFGPTRATDGRRLLTQHACWMDTVLPSKRAGWTRSCPATPQLRPSALESTTSVLFGPASALDGRRLLTQHA